MHAGRFLQVLIFFSPVDTPGLQILFPDPQKQFVTWRELTLQEYSKKQREKYTPLKMHVTG